MPVHEFELIDALDAAAAAGIDVTVKIKSQRQPEGHVHPQYARTSRQQIQVSYAPLGAEWAGQDVLYASDSFPTLAEAVRFIENMTRQIKVRPLPELKEYQIIEEEGLLFAGINSYRGRWMFPNGWGLSVVRRNGYSHGSINFEAMLIYESTYIDPHALNGEWSLSELGNVAREVRGYSHVPSDCYHSGGVY